MNLKELHRKFRDHPAPLELVSTEGDIYLCRISGGAWLTDQSGKKPMQFHSIFQAREHLGKKLSANMELIMPIVYDEMIGEQDRLQY